MWEILELKKIKLNFLKEKVKFGKFIKNSIILCILYSVKFIHNFLHTFTYN